MATLQEIDQNLPQTESELENDTNKEFEETKDSENFETTENSQDLENAEQSEQPEEEDERWTRKPTLPSWLLDVDKKIEAFKQNYSEYKKEYDTLTGKISVFNEKQKQAKKDDMMKKYFKHQLEQQKEANKIHFYDLPKYTLMEIAKFISKDYAPELIRLTRVCSTLYHKLNDENVWKMIVQDYFGRAFVVANEKNISIFENEQKKAMAKIEKKLQNQRHINKLAAPKHHVKPVHENPHPIEPKNIHAKRDEFYWAAIFKNIHARFRLTRSTFKTLYDSKFPKNNDFSLLNTEINKSLGFVIETFSTVGTHEFNDKLRILELIKEMVRDQKSLLALIRLCNNDNGVIKVNSLTLILILLGYFRDLKKNFLEFTSFTLIQRLQTIDKEFNITIFAVNISDFDLCIIPDIAGYRLYFKDIRSRLDYKAQINFQNSFPAQLPLDGANMKWQGAFLNAIGQITQPFRCTLKLDTKKQSIIGFVEYYRKNPETEEENRIVEKIRGTLDTNILHKRLENMKVPNPMRSFREPIGKVFIGEENSLEDELELGLDIALSVKHEGWFVCLHGCSLLGKIFFCYQKME